MGTETLVIEGVAHLNNNISYEIMADRIVAGTYMMAARGHRRKYSAAECERRRHSLYHTYIDVYGLQLQYSGNKDSLVRSEKTASCGLCLYGTFSRISDRYAVPIDEQSHHGGR